MLSTLAVILTLDLTYSQLNKNYPNLKQCLLLFLLIRLAPVLAQGEGNIWYFGNKAGLNFNSGTPIAVTNGQLNTLEGSSGISDAQGNLLFYTNGVKVWNANHMLMQNGSGLFGDPSSSQAAVVVPKPGSASTYYIFTTNSFETNGGLRYSIVDMAAAGGQGAVVEKNELLSASTCEKITVVHHQNGVDYWIITHLLGSNGFLAHRLTNQGISPNPTTSFTGINVVEDTDHANAIGYMKVSPDGTKLAVCHTYMNKAQLFDFDAATGAVSNPRMITSGGLEPYGVEFSPSGNWLYLSSVYPKKILRYDLSAAQIEPTQETLVTPPTVVGALQMGPDGKIYVAMPETSALSIIDNPDNTGGGCSVQLHAVSLGGRICMMGLPAFNQSLFNTRIGIVDTCFGSATQFSLYSGFDIQTAFWDFGDGTTSAELNPTHIYTQPGNYTVTVTAGNSLFTLGRSKGLTIASAPVANQVPDQAVCVAGSELHELSKYDDVLLGSQDPALMRTSYYISLADAHADLNALPAAIQLAVGNTGLFGRVSNMLTGCYDVTGFTISVYELPEFNQPQDYSECAQDGTAVFDFTLTTEEILGGRPYEVSYYTNLDNAHTATDAIGTSYQTGDSQTIYVRIENPLSGCYEIAQFELIVLTDCVQTPEFAFPKFFTPNGDGYNDTWFLADAPQGTIIRIYDRYGKLVNEITGDKAWNGTLAGRQLPADDYWFAMTAPGIQEIRGHFSLKR